MTVYRATRRIVYQTLGILLTFLLFTIFVGCGGRAPGPLHPNTNGPAKATAPQPYVDFVGTGLAIELVQAENDGMWQCTVCTTIKTSAGMVAAAPTLVA